MTENPGTAAQHDNFGLPDDQEDLQTGKFPAQVFTIVLDGGGYSAGAEQWIKGQAGNNRLRHVLDLGDFQRFVSRGEL